MVATEFSTQGKIHTYSAVILYKETIHNNPMIWCSHNISYVSQPHLSSWKALFADIYSAIALRWWKSPFACRSLYGFCHTVLFRVSWPKLSSFVFSASILHTVMFYCGWYGTAQNDDEVGVALMRSMLVLVQELLNCNIHLFPFPSLHLSCRRLFLCCEIMFKASQSKKCSPFSLSFHSDCSLQCTGFG